MTEEQKRSVAETLARARQTVAASRELMAQAEMRIQETDRFLAKQGLTREQVRRMRFTKEQRLLANEQLQRMGLPPIEEDESASFDAQTAELRQNATRSVRPGAAAEPVVEDVVGERRRKLGAFMQGFRL